MTIGRYAVIDETGKKLNGILIDDNTAVVFWPGYGVALVREGEQPPDPSLPPPQPKPVDFGILDITPDKPMDIGDSIDTKTGEVTKAPPPPEVVEEIL